MSRQELTESAAKKNIVITGANSGIGLEAARGLFGDGHHIFFGSRNEKRNAEAVAEIKASFPKSTGSIDCFPLDLSQRASVDKFATAVKDRFKSIDILLNNSGFMANERKLNEDNIEMTMAVNHYGHFYLTYLLFPLLKDTKEGRIVNTSSFKHLDASEHPMKDPACEEDFGGWAQYNKSKLANTMFSVGLSERFKKSGLNLKAVSLNPGIVQTGFQQASGMCLLKWLECCCCCIMKSQESGAASTLHVCRCCYEHLQNGEYYDSDSAVVRKHEMAEDQAQVDRLWTTSEKVYNIEFKI